MKNRLLILQRLENSLQIINNLKDGVLFNKSTDDELLEKIKRAKYYLSVAENIITLDKKSFNETI